jgi:hypothetical protein
MQISYDDYLRLRGLLTLADDHRRVMEQLEGSVKRLLQTESDIVSDEVWGFSRGADDLLRKLDIAVGGSASYGFPEKSATIASPICAECGVPIARLPVHAHGTHDHSVRIGETPSTCAQCGGLIVFAWRHADLVLRNHVATLKEPAQVFTEERTGAFCAQCSGHITLNGETWEHDGPTQPRHIATPKE